MSAAAVSHETTTIALVGGGLAALVLVQQLRQRLAGITRGAQLLVIDPATPDQFGRGVAYAAPWQPEHPHRVGSCAELLNSPASRMSLAHVIGPEGDFVKWLQRHRQSWQQRLGLELHDGKLQQAAITESQPWEQQAIGQWLQFNRHALDAGQYETVYLPRCVYGDFIAELAANVLTKPANQLLTLRYIQAKVQRLEASNTRTGQHTLTVIEAGQNAVTLPCDYLVYAGGDLPPQPLGERLKPQAMVLQNLYALPRHHYHQQLRHALSSSIEPVQLLIAGGNACSLDFLWGLANDQALRDAMQRGSLQVKQVAPTTMPHSGTVLQPLPSGQIPDPLRWVSQKQQRLLQHLRSEFLDPNMEFTAASYFTAVCSALAQLEERASPHLFMLFLRQLGEVEQDIRDGLPDIEYFAADYHARLESRLLFTPYEYWHCVHLLGENPIALERIKDKVIGLRERQGRFTVQLTSGGTLDCDAVVNCTGSRNPFATTGATPLDQLVALGVDNGTGGFYLASDGRLKLANGTFSKSIYLITQRSIGLHQSEAGAAPRFVSANRLTAVRVAELARAVAAALTQRLQDEP